VTVDTGTAAGVSARLAALHELTKLGLARKGGFDTGLLADADTLLRRSGERMRMSSSHTVVALAGGTGSGKSSLFNALSGATFSPPGVTRPITRHAHACVWGMEGAAPLLDWLGVQRRHRYARASALDEGEANLTGLLLLDLPDHDSVVSGSQAMVDRMVKLTDMLIWVLDPLKYADASVHQRYLVPLAGHAAVTTVVLNQADTLTPEQVSDCESDLRRLLDGEGLLDTQVLVTSATTGLGLDELKVVLGDAVAARRAVSDRIAADIDVLLERFAGYAGDPLPGLQYGVRPGEMALTVTAQRDLDRDLHRDLHPDPDPEPAAARPPWELWDDVEDDSDGGDGGGRDGDGDGDGDDVKPVSKPPWEEDGAEDWNPWGSEAAAQSPAASRPPWEDAGQQGDGKPKPDPVSFVPVAPSAALAAAFERAAGVSAVTEGLHSARERTAIRYVGWPLARLRGRPAARRQEATESPRAQRSDIDNAITEFADEVGGSLPEPWSRTVRAAARSKAADAEGALGTAVAHGLPPRHRVTGWWRLIALAQWLLMLLVAGGIVWIGAVLAFGEFHVTHKVPPSLIGDVSLIPWLAVMVVALLLLGSLTASWCQNVVVLAADREREQALRAIRANIASVTRDLVLAPVGAELADYDRYRTELATARGA
jgi:GTP-binding protein EngB required for normal cell division